MKKVSNKFLSWKLGPKIQILNYNEGIKLNFYLRLTFSSKIFHSFDGKTMYPFRKNWKTLRSFVTVAGNPYTKIHTIFSQISFGHKKLLQSFLSTLLVGCALTHWKAVNSVRIWNLLFQYNHCFFLCASIFFHLEGPKEATFSPEPCQGRFSNLTSWEIQFPKHGNCKFLLLANLVC